MVKVIFITKEGEVSVDAPEGLSVLEVAKENNIDIEGACEGALACSTCHVIVDPCDYNRLSPPSEEEEDMLDLAFGLQETSRLCCQIIVEKDIDGIKVTLPDASRNIKHP